MNHAQYAGKIGEDSVCEYLRTNGINILGRNFRTKFGEIDIIANEDDTLIFIEVKARTNKRYGNPCEAVTYKKQKAISAAAILYIAENNLTDKNVRFDVAEVILNPGNTASVHYIENAFEWVEVRM